MRELATLAEHGAWTRSGRQDLEEACQVIGRDPQTIEVSVGIMVKDPQTIDRNEAEGVAGAAENIAEAFATWAQEGVDEIMCWRLVVKSQFQLGATAVLKPFSGAMRAPKFQSSVLIHAHFRRTGGALANTGPPSGR